MLNTRVERCDKVYKIATLSSYTVVLILYTLYIYSAQCIKMQSLNTKRNKPKSRLCTASLSFMLTHSSGRLSFFKIPNTCFLYLVYGKGTIEQLLKGGMNSGKGIGHGYPKYLA